MAKYDVKFSCGHTETISLIGPVAERERKIKYFEEYGVCSECYKKQKEAEREKQNAENAKKAADYGMAELEGSEKQVAWANTIRVELLEAVQSSRDDEQTEIDAEMEKLEKLPQVEDAEERSKLENKYNKYIERCKKALKFIDVLEKVIGSEKSASTIIDWRGTNVGAITFKYERIMDKLESGEETPDDYSDTNPDLLIRALKAIYPWEEEEKEVQKEETKKPEEEVLATDGSSSTLAEISYNENEVLVSSPKDYTVISIVKELGYRWTGSAWRLGIYYQTGEATDRAAEAANRLLNAGIQVKVPVEIKDAAVSGDYKPRQYKWFYAYSSEKKNVYASWPKDADLYDDVKGISGAKWDSANHAMRIPASSADEIEDFAKIHNFSLSEGAKRVLENYRNSIQIVAPQEQKPVEEESAEKQLKKVLESSDAVLDELKDD